MPPATGNGATLPPTGAREPPSARLVFFGDTIRPVAVYLGRAVPSVTAPPEVSPGITVIAREPDYERLARAGRVGPPLLEARGRVGNLAGSRALLAEGR